MLPNDGCSAPRSGTEPVVTLAQLAVPSPKDSAVQEARRRTDLSDDPQSAFGSDADWGHIPGRRARWCALLGE
jgi:hypothetical protein